MVIIASVGNDPAPRERTPGSLPKATELISTSGCRCSQSRNGAMRFSAALDGFVGAELDVRLDDAGIHRRHQVAADDRHDVADAQRQQRHHGQGHQGAPQPGTAPGGKLQDRQIGLHQPAEGLLVSPSSHFSIRHLSVPLR